MKTISTEQVISLAIAAAPFFVFQTGNPKTGALLGAAVIVGEYLYANSTFDGTEAMPYTSNEWTTVGIYAVGLAAAYWKPQWALAIGAGVLAVDIYRAGGFGSQLPGRTPPES